MFWVSSYDLFNYFVKKGMYTTIIWCMILKENSK